MHPRNIRPTNTTTTTGSYGIRRLDAAQGSATVEVPEEIAAQLHSLLQSPEGMAALKASLSQLAQPAQPAAPPAQAQDGRNRLRLDPGVDVEKVAAFMARQGY